MSNEKKIILIFGKRGSGKSYLAKKLIDQEPRLFVYDTLGEYNNGVIFEDYSDCLMFWRHVHKGKFRIIYRPLQPAEEIEAVAELIFACGNICFLVEEIDCFCTSFQIQENFAHIVQRGRHKDIKLIGVTQRPYGIHRLLTSQAKEIYIFNTTEPRDRDYLKTSFGQEIEEKLNQLEQYQYVKWTDGQSDLQIACA